MMLLEDAENQKGQKVMIIESIDSIEVTKVIDSVRELTPQVIEHKRVRSQVVERNTYTPVLSHPNDHVHSLVSTPSKKTGENAPRERGDEYHHVMTPLFLNPNKGGYGRWSINLSSVGVDKKQADHTVFIEYALYLGNDAWNGKVKDREW